MCRRVFLLLFLLPAASHAAPSRIVHVYVALCDNLNQGIVPVPKHLGRGDHPASNLYWGAAFGVRTFLRKHPEWEEVNVVAGPKSEILERVIFRHRHEDIYLVADAYKGDSLRVAIKDFLTAASGGARERVAFSRAQEATAFETGGAASLLGFVGHNGLMDFNIEPVKSNREGHREVVILACASKPYFDRLLRGSGAKPLLWTTNLMAPEAYVLAATLSGWAKQESAEQIRRRAARAYCSYQKCSEKAGLRLFVTGW